MTDAQAAELPDIRSAEEIARSLWVYLDGAQKELDRLRESHECEVTMRVHFHGGEESMTLADVSEWSIQVMKIEAVPHETH